VVHDGQVVRALPSPAVSGSETLPELVEAARHLLRTTEGMCARLRTVLARIDGLVQAEEAELDAAVERNPAGRRQP
jgi:hypothetical protein